MCPDVHRASLFAKVSVIYSGTYLRLKSPWYLPGRALTGLPWDQLKETAGCPLMSADGEMPSLLLCSGLHHVWGLIGGRPLLPSTAVLLQQRRSSGALILSSWWCLEPFLVVTLEVAIGESQFLGRLITSLGVPKERGLGFSRRRWGLEFSRRRKGQISTPPTFLSLSHIKRFFL